MALNKELVMDNWVTATYHNIKRVISESGKVTVYHYLDKATRDAGNDPVGTSSYTILDSETKLSEENLKADGKTLKVLAYDWLKAEPETRTEAILDENGIATWEQEVAIETKPLSWATDV